MQIQAAASALSIPLILFGCAHFKPPAESASPSAVGGTASIPADQCAHAAAIEDGENNDSQTLLRGGRGGYIYTYADKNGTTVRPAGDFTMSKNGAEGSRYALRMQGALANAADVYAGMGFSFVDPMGAYNAARYSGVAFYARKSPDSTSGLRFKVPDSNTDPEAGRCDECYNDFGVSFQLTDEWTRYEVSFADLKQEQGWGNPRPDAVDSTTMYGLQWQVSSRNASYDIWIDEISFVGGCPDAP